MRFVCYVDQGAGEQLGLELFGVVYDLPATVERVSSLLGLAAPPVPPSLWAYHAWPPEQKAQLAEIVRRLPELGPEHVRDLMRQHARRLPPVPRPSSVRCFAAFEEHARILRQRCGMGMPAQWHEVPVFHFGNPNAVYGPGAEIPHPASFWLDYELQVACVIGREGANIRAEEAAAYILGYTIMNDWCARDLEMYEMRLGVSPAKGRDFAISIGPALVTPDELAPYAIGEGIQRRYDLKMTVSVNERLLATGNFRQIHFTFAQMIERASADVTLYPGDIFGSGAVGNGSLLALGGEEALGRWLQPGDVVDLEVEVLGVLRNTIAPPRV